MKRKIIKLGQATYVASLPSKWIRKFNLKQGDYLEVEEKDNSLLISTEKPLEHRAITIELPRKELFVKRLIYTPYRFGYDEITFTYKNPELIKKIQKAAEILMGFEIVDQGEKHCTFRNISSTFEDEFENIFKRVFLIILNLMKDSINILKEKQFTRFQNLLETESIIDKLTCFCERVINKRGSKDFMKNSFSYITAWTLEQIGDDIKDLSHELNHFKDISPIIIKSFEESQKLFELFFHLYYKPSLEGIHQFKKEHQLLNKKLLENLTRIPQQEIPTLHYLTNIVNKTNNVALSIQEVPSN